MPVGGEIYIDPDYVLMLPFEGGEEGEGDRGEGGERGI